MIPVSIASAIAVASLRWSAPGPRAHSPIASMTLISSPLSPQSALFRAVARANTATMKANRASGLGSGLDVATLQSAADRQWQFVSEMTAQRAAFRVAQRRAHRAGRRATSAALVPHPGDGTAVVGTAR